jgi:predicted MFS family arabinose efflux permease
MTVAGFSGYAALLPVTPLWAAHGGAGSTGAGAVNGVLLLSTVATQAFVPGALRRFGWGPVLVFGMLLLGLPPLGHVMTDALAPTLGLSAVRGLGFAVLTVTAGAAIAELVDPAHRGRALGAYGLSIAGPQLALMPIAPWVSDTLGFWIVFVISACPILGCFPALVLARTLQSKSRAHDEQHTQELPRARREPSRRLLRPMLLLLGATLAGGALITFTPHMTSSSMHTTMGLVVFTAMAAVSRWRIGGLADRYGAQPFLWPLVVMTALGLAVIAWAVRDPATTAATPLLMGMAIVGLGYGGLQNLTLFVALHSGGRQDYGVASVVWNGVFDVGMGLGAVLAGLIASETSFTVAMATFGAFSLTTLPLAFKKRHASTSAQAPVLASTD